MKRLLGLMDLKWAFPIIEMENMAVHNMLKMCIQSPDVFIYMNASEDAMILFLPLDRYKYNTHIYTLESGRGRKLKSFMLEAGIKMFNETTCTTLMYFVEEDNKGLQMFVSDVGSTRVGIIKNSSEQGNTVLYCAYKEDFV